MRVTELILICFFIISIYIFASGNNNDNHELVQPVVKIVGHEKVKTFSGQESWYLNWLVDLHAEQESFSTEEKLYEMIKMLTEDYNANWLGCDE